MVTAHDDGVPERIDLSPPIVHDASEPRVEGLRGIGVTITIRIRFNTWGERERQTERQRERETETDREM